jgi:hypothetical protein
MKQKLKKWVGKSLGKSESEMYTRIKFRRQKVHVYISLPATDVPN